MGSWGRTRYRQPDEARDRPARRAADQDRRRDRAGLSNVRRDAFLRRSHLQPAVEEDELAAGFEQPWLERRGRDDGARSGRYANRRLRPSIDWQWSL